MAHLVTAYFAEHPDPADPSSSSPSARPATAARASTASFNEDHILATTQAICEYRHGQGIDGPLFLGRDTHALSEPAWVSALEVLVANDVTVLVDSAGPLHADAGRVARHPAGQRRPLDRASADGIVVTPSHNPPSDGGFKYNPPHGGPADTDATGWIARRANELLAAGLAGVRRVPVPPRPRAAATPYEFLATYVDDLPTVVDIDAIRSAGVRIGADPLGGASVDYWGAIAERHRLDLTVVNPLVDPTWRFMTLDWDGKIRMDCSSADAMASLIGRRAEFQIATGNDADADRHGIVTPDAGLMNPNHFLAVAIAYLYASRDGWSPTAAVGKTLVSSSMIDRVAAELGRRLDEVPVGFKWFVPGLLDGSVGFGGEESAGASFLRRDGTVWTTDKDGILLALLASEILATTGRSPSAHYAELTAAPRRAGLRPGRRPGLAGGEGQAGCAVPRGRHRHRAGRRADHGQADHGTRATARRSAGSRSSRRRRGSPPGRRAPRTSTRSTPSRSAVPSTSPRSRPRPARSSPRRSLNAPFTSAQRGRNGSCLR